MGIVQHVEQSIHFGYMELIRNAKEFIYIENQFFMGIQHKVIDTIIERIDRAFKNKENFKIIVMLPLLPGFPG
jgi:phospholipase D1/2